MTINPHNLAGTASMTFDDEFNSLSLWNGTSGTWSTDFWYDPLRGNGNTLSSNGEEEWYINSNDKQTKSIKPWTVSNGHMVLTLSHASAATQSLIDGYKYTSGEINTFHSFSQEYGYFEMRAKLPAGQGLWPAFWMLPENGTWPPEIDIMEVLGNDPTTLYVSTHSEKNGVEINKGPGVTVADTSKGFHTYAVDWEKDYITYYFDGQAVWKTKTPADMHQPMYMEANLAAGGPWAGNIDSTTKTPAHMVIDYIRAYQAKPANATEFIADNKPGQALNGTAHSDVLFGGTGGAIMHGRAGADTFVMDHLPLAAATVADFNPSQDKLDLSALFKTAHVDGANPFAGGHLKLVAGSAGTEVFFDPDGTAGSHAAVEVAVLDNVATTDLVVGQNLITETSHGQRFIASDIKGQHLFGTDGNDSFFAGDHGIGLTGGAGADHFNFDSVPTTSGWISDYRPGVDKVDLSALFEAAGLDGAHPKADGNLILRDAGGNTRVFFDDDGSGPDARVHITTLKGVTPDELHHGDIVTAPHEGKVLTANDTAGQVLKGTSGNDVFHAGQDAVTMTGGAGADTFVFDNQPWNAGHITDFNPAVDHIDVSALMADAGYTGNAPFTAGLMNVVVTPQGSTQVYYDPDHGVNEILLTTLDHTLPSQLDLVKDFLLH